MFVTQVEHPYTGRPAYVVHPCQTARLMATLMGGTSGGGGGGGGGEVDVRRYLLVWFNVYGRAAGLAVPADAYVRASRALLGRFSGSVDINDDSTTRHRQKQELEVY